MEDALAGIAALLSSAARLTFCRGRDRLWTLRFADGFPVGQTVENVFNNLDLQRCVQTMMVAMPDKLRAGFAPADG